MKPVYDQQIKKSQSWMMFAKNESGMKNICSSSAESYDGSNNNNNNNLEIVWHALNCGKRCLQKILT